MSRGLGLALALLGACSLPGYDLGGGGGDGRIDAGVIVLDDGFVVRPPDAAPDASGCTPSGLDDTCDELDNDCDGITDNAFDKQDDDSNCGVCGRRCVGVGAVQDCSAGVCVFAACQPGFADLDAEPLTCEYRCPLFPTIAEACNGVDDDCDGTVDEDLPPAPTDLCRTLAGTPCEGTVAVCEARGGETRWWCGYGADVEFDATIPNGIFLQEQRCDGLDGDCDGVVDDAWPDVGQACDDGAFGICRDVGVRVCDPADVTQTTCDLTPLPDPQAPTTEACDGRDNDCDNVVDEDAVDAMTLVSAPGGDFLIDTYEASRPDATLTGQGASSARACSNPAVQPWRSVTFATAAAACAAAGKVLCSSARWQAACEGATADVYPYGDVFDGGRCNAERFDGVPGGADDDVLLATGAAAMCTSAAGVLDLSGNLKEWTDDITGTTPGGTNIAVLRGGAYDTPAVGATCAFRASRAAVDAILPSVGFRCCRAP